LRDGCAATKRKETNSGRQRRRKKCRMRIYTDYIYGLYIYTEYIFICGVEEGCVEHIMSHMRIKIGLDEVLDERKKGEIVK